MTDVAAEGSFTACAYVSSVLHTLCLEEYKSFCLFGWEFCSHFTEAKGEREKEVALCVKLGKF